ncbi:hypothetical protein I4U23_001399 [Adineta vaga]|nr:hypothetical protein I4U23_001399 [Adineta vaga]
MDSVTGNLVQNDDMSWPSSVEVNECIVERTDTTDRGIQSTVGSIFLSQTCKPYPS